MKVNKKYFYIIFLLFTFLLFFKTDFRFETSVNCCGDDHDYYMHSETIALDRDLNYSNQLKGNEDKRFSFNGKIAPTGFIGSGIFSAPFTFLGNFIDNILENTKSKSSKILNFRILFYSLSSITYFFGTVFLTKKAFDILNYKISVFQVLLIYFGSGVSYFAFERFSMSHVYEVFSTTLLIYLCVYFYNNKESNFIALLIPISLFLGVSVRWVNYFLFFIPIICKNFSNKSMYAKNTLIKNYYFIFAYLSSVWLFFWHTNKLYGKTTFNPEFVYQTSNQINNFINSSSGITSFLYGNLINIFKIFFSQEFGIFWFSPAIFLSVVFLLLILFDKKFLSFRIKFVLLLCYSQVFAIVLLWKSTASSYGFRYLYCLIPLSLLIIYGYQNKKNYNFLKFYLIGFSLFASISVLFFETTPLTQLSTVEVTNSFGRTLKYSQPLYLSGIVQSFVIVDSYLKIFTTSFLGATIFKILFNTFGKENILNTLENFGLPINNNDFINYTLELEMINISKFLIVIIYFSIFSYYLVKNYEQR